MATEGYVPKTGTDAPLRMLDRINEWEKLYDSQNREYRQLKLRALMGQQEGEQQAANMEASAAGQAYNLAQKQYDALLGYMWKAQQEKQKRAEDLREKKSKKYGVKITSKWPAREPQRRLQPPAHAQPQPPTKPSSSFSTATKRPS